MASDTLPSPWSDDPRLGPLVVSERQIQEVVAALGAAISADYDEDTPLLCVTVLKGAFLFIADLARAITCPVEFDFMAVGSYGGGTRSSGVVRILKDLDANVAGRHVLIVEDVIDSGLTLSWLRRTLLARDPASLRVCSLLVKGTEYREGFDLAYEGIRLSSEFVVGYGLDADERYRNLPFLCRFNGDGGSASSQP